MISRDGIWRDFYYFTMTRLDIAAVGVSRVHNADILLDFASCRFSSLFMSQDSCQHLLILLLVIVLRLGLLQPSQPVIHLEESFSFPRIRVVDILLPLEEHLLLHNIRLVQRDK